MFKQYLLLALAFAGVNPVTPSPHLSRPAETGQGPVVTLGDTIYHAINSAVSAVMSGHRFANLGGENYIVGSPHEQSYLDHGASFKNKLDGDYNTQLWMSGPVVSHGDKSFIASLRDFSIPAHTFRVNYPDTPIPCPFRASVRLESRVAFPTGDWNFTGTIGPDDMIAFFYNKEGFKLAIMSGPLDRSLHETYPIYGQFVGDE